MNCVDKLKKYSKKTISLADLKILFEVHTDEDIYQIVKCFCEQGLLSPIKASGSNGNRIYRMHQKYKIHIVEDHSDTLQEISALHPSLQKTDYFYKHPEQYEMYRKNIQKLNQYLFSFHQEQVEVSRKERSFEIFGEEKLLDDSGFSSILKNLNITKENLKFYDTPEYCFNDYIPERKDSMVLLICENKDIWFNIRRRMFEDQAYSLFGVLLDGVVYGNGNKVSGKQALTAYTDFMGTKNVKYLYWGDIDRAGLNIFMTAKQNNPDLNIELFGPAYQKMLQLAENRELPDSIDQRGIVEDYNEIYELFTVEDQIKLKKYLDDNKRLPQEIISYAVLQKVMR